MYRTRTRLVASVGTASNRAATSRGQIPRRRTAVWNDRSPARNNHNHNHYNNNNYYYRERRRHRPLAYSGDDRSQRRLATVSMRRQDAC